MVTTPAAGDATVAVILKGYPRLSETFIAQEIHALEQRGLSLAIVSLRQPTDGKVHPVHAAIAAPVFYLPDYLHRQPLRVWRAWRLARRLPGYRRAVRAWLRDWRRDPTPNRGRRFGQALVLAAERGTMAAPDKPIRHLHVHFLHTPGSVARYTALMTGLPWSASAHAKDIWTLPDWEKREKLADMQWLATCTAAGHTHLAGLAPDRDRVRLIYHGLDLDALPAPPAAPSQRRGTAATDRFEIVSVGRAVPKKGYDVLLDALARLPPTLAWRLRHIGGGQQRRTLERQAARLRIADRIVWLGSRSRDDVFATLADGDLFVLPSRIAADGDRDGLPNVLMEAASQKLCLLSTTVAAIPEFIDPGRTGILVPPDDPAALAAAMADLAGDPARRAALAAAAHDRLLAHFPMTAGIDRLATWLAVPGMANQDSMTDQGRTADQGNPPATAMVSR